MLFATLDPTARASDPALAASTVVLVDTVGFVSRLPHHLVDAFKSTLEEAAFADVLVRVCRLASDPAAAEQLAVTDEVLDELGCGEIPRLTVYNKCDKAAGGTSFDTSDILLTSARPPAGVWMI